MKNIREIAARTLEQITATYEPGDNEHHHSADPLTGYRGRKGAGAILYSRDTDQYLFIKRSSNVTEPNTWAGVGGTVEDGETDEEACRREIGEEIGYKGPMELIPLMVYTDSNFSYQNYVGIVPKEFLPILNWESVGYRWCHVGRWPDPLHFGIKALLSDEPSMRVMTTLDGM